MSDLHESELGGAIREVLKRSVADPEFRALAESNSAAALQQVSGKSLPGDTTITFVSNAGKAAKLVVLPDPVVQGDMLSEEELEQVAGGMACGASTCGTSSVND